MEPPLFSRPSHGGETSGINMGALCEVLTIPTLVQASTGNVGTIIETFVVRQFPNAAGHYWLINETPWDGDEMTMDVHTIVKEQRETEPTLRHSCC
jgi:hypothetical protein